MTSGPQRIPKSTPPNFGPESAAPLPRIASINEATLDSCENCGHLPLSPFCVPEQTLLWKCPECGLYQKGMPAGDLSYEETYHDSYMSQRKRKLRTAAVRINHLAPMLYRNHPFTLDVGCSIGATVEAATGRGWQAFGVDVSQSAINWCRDQGLNCQHFDGARLPYPSTMFDMITAWHVLEHVRDVRAALLEWTRVLRPGGILAIEVPNANCLKARMLGPRYRKFWPAAHYYAFTSQSLISLLESTGLQVVSPPLVASMNRLPIAMLAYGAARRVGIGITRLAGLSKSIQVIGRKPLATAEFPRLARVA